MQRLAKKRMGRYISPYGMTVRGYNDERFASAPPDATSFTNPTPQQRLDPTHRDAAVRIAIDAIGGFASGVAEDIFKNPKNAARNGLEQAKSDAVKSVVENCVTCHLTKKN